ncbi:MAG: recombinase RecT [Lautropia sp.]
MNELANIIFDKDLEAAFKDASVDRGVIFEREAQFAYQIISASDYATKLAIARPLSVKDAIFNVSAIGISLNPARKQAYLVPRDGMIKLDISYMGLIDIAVGSGAIQWAQARVFRRGETFELFGYDRAPIHRFEPFAELPDGQEEPPVIGAYVVAKTAGGDYLTETMKIREIHKIRDRSKAWQAYLKDKKTCPWVTDPEEMDKKTVIKRAYKTWPRNERVAKAIHHLNVDNDEGIDFGAEATVASTIQRPRAVDPGPATDVPAGPAAPAAPAAATPASSATAAASAAGDDRPATDGERAHLTTKFKSAGRTPEEAMQACGFPADGFAALTKSQFGALRAWINGGGQKAA